MFEIGCDLFTKNPKGDVYKEMDKWWLINASDFMEQIDDPEVVKVTSNRSKYKLRMMLFEFSSVKHSQGSSFSKQLVLKAIIFIVHGKVLYGLISTERWFVNIKQKAEKIKRIKKTAKGKKKISFFLFAHNNLRILVDRQKQNDDMRNNIIGKNSLIFLFIFYTRIHQMVELFFKKKNISKNRHASTNMATLLRINRHIYIYIYIYNCWVTTAEIMM